MTDSAKAVTFWGTYDAEKPRVRLLRDGLADCGYVVEEININVWSGVRDKSQVKGVGAWLQIAWRMACAYPVLLLRLLRSKSGNPVVVPYLGQLDVLVAWPMSRILRRALILDIFISIYDTLVDDRRLLNGRSPLGKIVRSFERLAISCADLSIIDTAAHARRLERLFGLAEQRVGHVFVGVEDETFAPADPERPLCADSRLRVLFYGQMSPLHGIDTILEAARIIGSDAIEFAIIGTGQEDKLIESMLSDMGGAHVTWLKWAPYDELRSHILHADVCLGVFGASEKAASVIPNKIFQIASVGRHIVTRDGPAIRELFSPGNPGITLIPPANPEALACALTRLAERKGELRGGVFHDDARSRIQRRAIGRDFAEQIERCHQP